MYPDKETLVLKYCENQDQDLQEKILVSYTPLVEYIAKKLTYNYSDYEDIVQVGKIGLLRSLDRFDPKKDVDFSTFATPNIIGEIKHYFRDKSRLVKVPRKLQELYSKIRTYIRKEQNYGRSPKIHEIAGALDVSEETVLEAMEVGQTSLVLSLDSPSYKGNSGGPDPSTPSLLESIGVDDKEEFLLTKQMLEQALQKLSKREQRIIELRFYLGLSQVEIANKMDLSQMHISRILSKSIQKLRQILESA